MLCHGMGRVIIPAWKVNEHESTAAIFLRSHNTRAHQEDRLLILVRKGLGT